jgi:hypothetical protein
MQGVLTRFHRDRPAAVNPRVIGPEARAIDSRPATIGGDVRRQIPDLQSEVCEISGLAVRVDHSQCLWLLSKRDRQC